MKLIFLTVFSALLFTLVTPAQTAPTAAAEGELTRLLNGFLDGASRNDAAIHDKFWADDLIYTGSGGVRRGKAELMKDVRSDPPPKPTDPKTVFTAEDVRVRQYGKTAVVAFLLVGTTIANSTEGDKVTIAKFFNTGTFVKRKGKWQVVAWQATRIPPAEDAKKN